MAEYVAVAVAGRDPAHVGALLNGGLRAKVAAFRKRGQMAVVLFEPQDGTTREALATAVRRIVETQLAGSARVSVGAAGPRRGVPGAHTAMLEAEHALVVGRALSGDGATTHFDDLGPYCFVLGRPPAEIEDFCRRVLGPLATDPERYEELERTLEEYLNAQGSLNEVSRRLSVHRNTVRQRLRRIERLTKTDLSDATARLSLHLAILGRRALDRLEAGAA